jgi:hypothetical protein
MINFRYNERKRLSQAVLDFNVRDMMYGFTSRSLATSPILLQCSCYYHDVTNLSSSGMTLY